MTDTAPLSYANRASILAQNQTMPRAKPAAVAPKRAVAPSPNGQISPSPVAKPAAAKPTGAVPRASPAKANVPAAVAGLTSPHGVKVVKAPKIGSAFVKAVPSGDSLVVQGNVTVAGQSAPEKMLVIGGIIAPKFAKGKSQVDEPFAFESREYLRKLAIGQTVQFDIQHTDEKSGREWATIHVKGRNLAIDILQHGWAKVKTSVNKDGKEREGPEDLVQAQEEAKQAGRGIWASNANEKLHIRSMNFNPDPRALYEANKGKPIPAIVDGVRDGSTLRVELLNGSEPLNHSIIFLHLAGVQCPRTPLPLSVLQQQHDNKVKDGFKGARPEAQDEAEPWALEAQQFTEIRLLNREVQVLLQGVDKLGNFFGTIVFSKGNISHKLLELGFAKFVGWSAALTNEADKLKVAEQQAKQARLRLWSEETSEADSDNVTSGTNGAATGPSWEGKVVSIVSGDTVIVVDSEGNEKRLSLASLRAPRRDAPFGAEAKEFLRSKLIGHRVKVIPEYTRTNINNDGNTESRLYVTLFQGKLNINEAVVGTGLTEVIRHRVDEDRSQFYDSYLSAEHQAEEQQKGKFSKKPQTAQKVIDLTDKPRQRKPKAPKKSDEESETAEEDEAEKQVDPREEERANKAKALSAKTKTYLSFLQRDKNVTAVVEFVFSASRYKLAIPKENILLSFALGGIRTPATNKSNDADNNDEHAAIGTQALQYVRSRILQHTVRIEVEALDKGDNFLGSLFTGKSNLAVDLLREGLASIVPFSAKRSPYSKELFAAESEAKHAKKGLWVNWTPEQEAESKTTDNGDNNGNESTVTINNEKLIPVKVTEIEDANDFWVHFLVDSSVDQLEESLRVFGESVSETAYHPANSSVVCAGQFNDGNWYRVKVEGKNSEGEYRVFFLDYGNHDVLSADRLRALPAELAKIQPLAHHCTLANVVAPKNVDYRESAALAFNDAVWGVELMAKIEHVDYNKLHHLTLVNPQEPFSINKLLLRDGQAKVNPRPVPKLRDQVAELKEHQDYAKQNHYNVWEYGDVSDDEEEKPQQTFGKRR